MTLKKLQRQIKPILKQALVRRAGIFGSAATGKMKAGSDVDVLVEMDKNADLLDFVRLKSNLEKKLRRKVDLITYGSLSPFIKKQADKEQIKIL